MTAFVHQKKNLVLILVNQTQAFAWNYVIMLIVCLSMENKSLSLKPTIKTLIFQQYCLRSISNGFIDIESRELSLNGNVYDV